MKKQQNLHILSRNDVDSLSPYNEFFPVGISVDYITKEQADNILDRATGLYDRLVTAKSDIYELYKKQPTERLIQNFYDIIGYADRISAQASSESYDHYFKKLNGFCGQIENILKMVRYYNSFFSS